MNLFLAFASCSLRWCWLERVYRHSFARCSLWWGARSRFIFPALQSFERKSTVFACSWSMWMEIASMSWGSFCARTSFGLNSFHKLQLFRCCCSIGPAMSCCFPSSKCSGSPARAGLCGRGSSYFPPFLSCCIWLASFENSNCWLLLSCFPCLLGGVQRRG